MFATRSRRITAAAIVLALVSNAAMAAGVSIPGSTRMFNPQPEPPRTQTGSMSELSIHSFNPQPEPPPATTTQGQTTVQR